MAPRTDIVPIDPYHDSRVEHKVAVLNVHTYHYLIGKPKDAPSKGTVFLIHGFPDLAIGWRYQIPFLVDMGFTVVAPDMMGYGGTDAPRCPPNDLRVYNLKNAANDLAELAKQLGVRKIILGGHDWGGMVVWRMAECYSELVSHVFVVCTPYSAPQKEYVSIEKLVATMLPQFAYQIQIRSGIVEKNIETPTCIRQFLSGMFGGSGPAREEIFDPHKGVIFENLDKIRDGWLLSEKELDYYTDQYSRNGLHGPANWYRTREGNWEDDQELVGQGGPKMPCLFIQANRDSALLPSMSKNMERHFEQLTRAEVETSHWALVEKPDETNRIIREWIQKEVLGQKSSL